MSNKNTNSAKIAKHPFNYTGPVLSHKNYSQATTHVLTTDKLKHSLMVDGDAVIKGNLKVGDTDIAQSLRCIESRLAILQINSELEAQFDELRSLGDQYREAEKKFLEQIELCKILRS